MTSSKLDADLILPNNYFKTIIGHFQQDPNIGMAEDLHTSKKRGMDSGKPDG
jgi:hypothetical protein